MPSSYPDSRIRSTLNVMKPKFLEVFKAKEEEVEWLLFTFAPGRVNFYGEHVDYMGGYVCPGGLREGCHILVGRVKKYGDVKLRFGTTKGEYFELDSIEDGAHNKDWSTFARGASIIMLSYLGKDLCDPAFRGVCILSHGTLPMGSGMSASASYGVALLNAIHTVGSGSYRRFSFKPSVGHFPELPKGTRDERITLTKQALLIETKYCGVNVGIMDQFSCVHATRGNFMALDCNLLEFTNHDIGRITGPDGCFLLIDSMVKHELTASDHGMGYNAIRADIEGAEQAVSKVKLNGKPFKFCHLARNPRKFTVGDPVKYVEECKHAMTPSQYGRGVFNIAEQLRTIEFINLTKDECKLPQEERYKIAGKFLNLTHVGQRDVLRISTPELNFIQECVNQDKDVAGARLMGGGYGGCVLTLLKKSAVKRVVATVQKGFQQKFNLTPAVYDVELCDGAFVVSLWEADKSNL